MQYLVVGFPSSSCFGHWKVTECYFCFYHMNIKVEIAFFFTLLPLLCTFSVSFIPAVLHRAAAQRLAATQMLEFFHNNAIKTLDLGFCSNGIIAKKVIELLWCPVLLLTFPLFPTHLAPHNPYMTPPALHTSFSHPPDKSSPGIRLFCTLTRGRERKKERGWVS